MKTYAAIGGVHRYSYTTNDIDGSASPGYQVFANQYNQLYAGDASTARDSGISITYNPRDAIFDLTIAATKANVNEVTRFQDPAHRTDFGGASEPQGGTPDLTALGVNFLQVGSGSGTTRYDFSQSNVFPVGEDAGSVERSTFFYQKPGTTTRYVTFAGFIRNATSVSKIEPDGGAAYLEQNHILERAAFVFGERTQNSSVPNTGRGSFSGPMIATLVYNPLLDTNSSTPTYFQWLSGTANTTVDFAASTFNIALAGSVTAPLFDIFTSREFALPAGSTFSAAGAGQISLVNAGGFLGQISAASFTRPDGVVLGVNIAGSSVDGAFYGPNADEVGGGFRIVGGTPDERIDILGAFTGKK